jgi:hypothetical protein
VSVSEFLPRFAEIRPGLERYPAVDADAFEKKIRAFVEQGAAE